MTAVIITAVVLVSALVIGHMRWADKERRSGRG